MSKDLFFSDINFTFRFQFTFEIGRFLFGAKTGFLLIFQGRHLENGAVHLSAIK